MDKLKGKALERRVARSKCLHPKLRALPEVPNLPGRKRFECKDCGRRMFLKARFRADRRRRQRGVEATV